MEDILRRNNVRVTGSGRQTLILAHGFGCDQNVWKYIIKAFEDTYRIVVFDYVGAGRSDLSAYSSSRYGSLKGYAQDILDICEVLDIRNAIFIGHSVSCMIGVLAVNEKPEYFEKMVMVAPSPRYLNDDGYVGGLERGDLENLFEVMDSNYLGWASLMAPKIMGNDDQPELGESLTNSFCATDPQIAKEFARVTFLTDSREDLKKLAVESLTLQCSDDMLAPLEVGYYINDNTPDNQLVIMNAEGHCPHLSAPQETIQAIEAFLSI